MCSSRELQERLKGLERPASSQNETGSERRSVAISESVYVENESEKNEETRLYDDITENQMEGHATIWRSPTAK